MKNLKRQTIQDMNQKIQMLEEKFNINMKVELAFDLKSVRTLGSVKTIKKDIKDRYIYSKIRLDLELLNEYGKTYLDDVLTHELCHMVTDIVHPHSKAHGKEFNYVCRLVGIEEGATTNSFKDSKVLKKRREKLNVNKITYRCGCQEHKVTKRMHNSIQNGNHRRCRICSTRLTLCS